MIANYSRRIYGYECDLYGHLNNANYLHLLEAARSEALVVVGMPVERLLKLNWHVYILKTEQEYFKPAMLDDVVEVRSEIIAMNKLRSTWKHEVYDSAGDLCFRGFVYIVHVFEGKPARVPDEIWAHFLRLAE